MIVSERKREWRRLIDLVQKVSSAQLVDLVICTDKKETCLISTVSVRERDGLEAEYKMLFDQIRDNKAYILNNNSDDFFKTTLVYPIVASKIRIWGFLLLKSTKPNKFNTALFEEISPLITALENQIKLDESKSIITDDEILSKDGVDTTVVENIELKNQLEVIMEIGQIAFVEYNYETNAYKTSTFFDELTGFKVSQIKPDLLWLISRIHPDDNKALIPIVKPSTDKKNNRVEAEFRFLNIHQEYVWFSFNGKFKINEDTKQLEKVEGIIQNINNQKDLFQELTAERNKSLQANKAKTNFLANMSHEIRTPMNAILGFSDILSKQIKEPHLQNYMKSIKASGKTLMSLINNLLDVSKIEAGKMILQHEALDFNSIVREVVQTFALKMNNKGISLELNPEPSFPASLSLDELRIRQVLLNLVGNAVKFTPKGKVVISYGFTINEQGGELGSLVITVQDTGIGINEDDQKEIFDPFTQEKSQINKKNQGTGLGLAITHKLVGLMGGRISLSSKVGVGSTFTVILPNVTLSKGIKTEAEEVGLDVKFNEEKVLIVDDVPSNQDVLVAYSKRLNLNTLLANDGLQGYKAALKNRPDIIFLDIQMPVMNGFETIKKLKQNTLLKDIPVIAISASTLQTEVNAIHNAGFDDFIDKPFKEQKLINTLVKYLKSYSVVTKETDQLFGDGGLKDLSSRELSDIKNCFEQSILPLWKELQVIQPSDKLKVFVTELNSILEIYNWQQMKQFIEEFEASISAFDFESIQLYLKKFEVFINQLEEIT